MTNKRDSSLHPFAALEKLRGKVPEGDPVKVQPIEPANKGPGRAVVRYERKHRGGKEVTLVEKLTLSSDALATWCRELKQALGCGGSVEENAIVLQGDQRKRLPDLLTARGVGKVVVS